MIPLSAKDVNTACCAVLNAILSEVMTVEVKSSMKTVRVFSVALVAIFLAVGLLFETDATSTGDAILVDVAPKVSQEEIDRQREAAAKRSEEESRIREQYLGSEEDIQYYAYLKVMRCLGWECNLHTNLIENDSFIEVPKRRKQRLRCFLLLRQDNAKQTAHSTGKERTHEHPQTHRLQCRVFRAGSTHGIAAFTDGIVL